MTARIGALMRSHKDLTNAVSHELKTPLSRLRFAVSLIPDATTTFVPVLLKPRSMDVDRFPDVRRVLEVTWSDGSRVRAWPGCDAALLQAALRGLLSAAQVGGQGEVASC